MNVRWLIALTIFLGGALSCNTPQAGQQTAGATPSKSGTSTTDPETVPGRWSEERVAAYYANRPWPVGANYNNRDAINQLEMWQDATFNPAQIDEELGWAAELGMNSMRVYLHNLLWEQDSTGLLERMERYLDIADDHGMSTTFVLFDAVWNPVAELGRQPEPRPRVHNSGWVQSPPLNQLTAGQTNYPAFEAYVKGVLRHFDGDGRILMWDVYNEPDNLNGARFPLDAQVPKQDLTYALLIETFRWAREVNASQPLTSGIWHGNIYRSDTLPRGHFNAVQLDNSDVISYHAYGAPDGHEALIRRLQRYNRPLVCTEYLARTHGSTFETYLPVFARERIGAYNWGLVSGKTNTIYPWSSWDSTFTAEPHLWHHDVFRGDGSLYREEEGEAFEEWVKNR